LAVKPLTSATDMFTDCTNAADDSVADDLAGRGFERDADLVDADVFAALGRELDVGGQCGIGCVLQHGGILPSSGAKGLSTTRQR
jgi:hypothetical protein